MLEDPVLRQIIAEIDSSPDRNKVLETFLINNNPIFSTFVDALLSTVNK